MTIAIGQALPEGTLIECDEFEAETGCPMNPRTVDVREAVAGKKIALFAVPGAFTPTCSKAHLPGFIRLHSELTSKGIDEIWCLAVNDPFVMAAWGREQKALGKIRMMADGSAEYTRRLGLERDLTPNGMGIRARRFAMLIVDGKVQYLGIEGSGQFELSTAETILAQL